MINIFFLFKGAAICSSFTRRHGMPSSVWSVSSIKAVEIKKSFDSYTELSNGKVTVKTEPCPSFSAYSMLPLCTFTSSWVKCNPIPILSPEKLLCINREKSCPRFSKGIPIPVSDTEMINFFVSSSTSTEQTIFPPSGVYLNALDRRL